jgi:hypothetical protein
MVLIGKYQKNQKDLNQRQYKKLKRFFVLLFHSNKTCVFCVKHAIRTATVYNAPRIKSLTLTFHVKCVARRIAVMITVLLCYMLKHVEN